MLITGCGPIGALCILAARHAGAERIIATDLSDYTLTMAQLCGADTPLNTAENPQALEEFHADKGQVDVHLECSGAAAALAAGRGLFAPARHLGPAGPRWRHDLANAGAYGQGNHSARLISFS